MTKIAVYLDDGRVFEYDVANPEKAREHSHAIVLTGYRHTDNEAGTMEHYPPHRIAKVKCSGGVSTSYPDAVRGT
jgi:hypothetical protein